MFDAKIESVTLRLDVQLSDGQVMVQKFRLTPDDDGSWWTIDPSLDAEGKWVLPYVFRALLSENADTGNLGAMAFALDADEVEALGLVP